MPRAAAEQIDERPRAMILVRNPFTHDSRVLREAAALEEIGYQVLIVAVASERVSAGRASVGGFEVLRLAPGSPLSWVRARLRRGDARPADTAERASSDQAAEVPSAEVAVSERPRAGVLTRLHRWLRTLDFYRRAIRVFNQQRPALVHCNDYNTMWVGVWARLRGGTAVVYDAHELWPDRNLRPEPRWWLLACEALFVRAAHRTLTASPGYARVMARRYRVPAPTVVRNIPAVDSAGGGEGERAAEGDGAVIYVGALTRNRGLEVAIEALAEVPGARLRLIGPALDGYAAELSALAQRVGVTERLELGVAVAPDRVVVEIAGASVGLALIQPACLSYELSLPNKLFEYALAGVPVLGSDLPVIGEFVRGHELGLVADVDDVGAVAAKLREMLDPERNRSLREAVRRGAAELDWEWESAVLKNAYHDARSQSQAHA